MLPVLPVCPVHQDREEALLGHPGGEEGEEVGGEGPGVLQGGVAEEAPEAVEAALGQGGEGGLLGEVGEGGAFGVGEEGGEEEGEVGAEGLSQGGEGLVDPGGDNLVEGVGGRHSFTTPLFDSPCQAPMEQTDESSATAWRSLSASLRSRVHPSV